MSLGLLSSLHCALFKYVANMMIMWVSLDANEFILAIPQYTHLLKINAWHECHQLLFFKKHILTICIINIYIHIQFTPYIYSIYRKYSIYDAGFPSVAVNAIG